MARSESPDTRLLHSLIRCPLALQSIYSAQCLRDRQLSALCAVNSHWFAVNCWEEKQKYRCHVRWLHLWIRVNKSRLFSVSSLSKEPIQKHCILGNELFYQSRNATHQPLNGIAQSNKAACQTTCCSHRIGRNIWQICINGYLYLTYLWI